MAAKPKLHYFDCRGRMESVRWLLAAAGVEYEEVLFKTAEDFENLIKGQMQITSSTIAHSPMTTLARNWYEMACIGMHMASLENGGNLMYQQVPMVEMDGVYMVQTRAILRYVAAKYNLYGKDLKERALIDMYVEGMRDLSDMIMFSLFSLAEEKQKNLNYILERATQRFFPVYEKALKDHGKNYLVGNQLSWADVQLLEAILMVEELKSGVLSAFPKLQEFKGRVSKLPRIQKFLQPGSPRKPQMDDASFEVARKTYKIDENLFLKHMG